MEQPIVDPEMRRRCEAACVKLAEAIAELDALGFQTQATHAHLCLELVRQHLKMPQRRRPSSDLTQ